MKLHNQQVYALVGEIQEELKKELEVVKQSEEFINFEASLVNDEDYKKFQQIKEIASTMSLGTNNAQWTKNNTSTYLNGYVAEMRNKKFPLNVPNQEVIKNKIILKTIEAENLEELINSVKESLK